MSVLNFSRICIQDSTRATLRHNGRSSVIFVTLTQEREKGIHQKGIRDSIIHDFIYSLLFAHEARQAFSISGRDEDLRSIETLSFSLQDFSVTTVIHEDAGCVLFGTYS